MNHKHQAWQSRWSWFDNVDHKTIVWWVQQNLPPGRCRQWFEKDRILHGNIAVIGMELRTQDDQDVLIFINQDGITV